MKILLIGKAGQIGYELQHSLHGLAELIAVDRMQMDLNDLVQVRDTIQAIRPALIVNAAAYTDVEKAESEPDLAMRINGEAPAVMAEEARKQGAAIIHYSTDYVFDGTKRLPYTEDDPPCPINSYGRSKLFGEEAIAAAGIPYLILRTCWIYGMRGRNFLITVLRLAAQRNELRIVDDQHGAPTWCRTVADTTRHIIQQSMLAKDGQDWWRQHTGIYHLAAQGQTTWYGFARAILEHAGIADKPVVIPVASSEYPSVARRPLNSVMNCERMLRTFCDLPDWEDALKLCLRS